MVTALRTLLELLGFGLLVAAAYLVAPPLALLVAGLGLILFATFGDLRRS